MAGELEVIIEGIFCVAKEGLPLKPIFMRNHPSFEQNEDRVILEDGVERRYHAKDVLLKVITKWFDSGVLEYVCRWHRLPQCFLACGAVPKATESWWRLITDGRPNN